MQARKEIILAIAALGLAQAACLIPSIVPDETVSEVIPVVGEEAETLEGDWAFGMDATTKFASSTGLDVPGLDVSEFVDDLPDGFSLDVEGEIKESGWVGQFNVNAGGRIVGDGTGTYKAEIFAVDDENCGTKWTVAGEGATFEFFLSNTIDLTGKIVPIRIDVHEVNVPAIKGQATCPDTPARDYGTLYLQTHISNLLNQIAGDATIIARKLPIECGLKDGQGKTVATISVARFVVSPEADEAIELEALSNEIPLAPLVPCD